MTPFRIEHLLLVGNMLMYIVRFLKVGTVVFIILGAVLDFNPAVIIGGALAIVVNAILFYAGSVFFNYLYYKEGGYDEEDDDEDEE